MKKGIFAGSFNPFHKGHLFIIEEALKQFDEVYVIVAINWKKRNKNTLDERYEDVKTKLSTFKNVEVIKLTSGLVAKKAKELGVKYLIRGIRNEVDKAYEEQIDKINKRYNKELETVFIKTTPELEKISSTLLRDN